MITLDRVSFSNRDEHRKTTVLTGASLMIPAGRRVALLGRNGAGKTSVLRLLSGASVPDKGKIYRAGSVSWPVGFTGGFSTHMTPAENVRFLARLHKRDPRATEAFVRQFAEIGEAFTSPWRTLSSGQKSRVSMGASMAIPFDLYLIDEATSVGDSAFRAKADAYLRDRLNRAGAVIVSHANETIRELCDCALIIENGTLTAYEDVSEAIEIHEQNMRRKT